MPVRHGTHDGADGQAVEVVVDENKDAEHEGCEYSADAGLDMSLRPAPEGCRAAGHIDQRYDDAE